MLEFVLEFGHEGGIVARLVVFGAQFLQRRHQGFGDENAAVGAKVAV